MAWGTLWGVDTLAKANTSPNGGTQTLYELVTSYYGRSPSFWGRYLNGSDPLDVAEVKYLLNEQFSQILPIYVAQNMANGKSGGVTDAKAALSTIESLMNQTGTGLEATIFVDMEDGDRGGATEAEITAYLEGWAETIAASAQFSSGIYYPTDCYNSSPWGCAFKAALSNSAVANSVLYSPEPEPGCSNPPGPAGPPVRPCCSNTYYGDTSRLAVWQYAESCGPFVCYNPSTGAYDGPCVDQDQANDATTGLILW